MRHRVFISYARSTSRAVAEALFDELARRAPGSAFLDVHDLADGDRFPEQIVDALLDSELVIVFAEPAYFERWYCLFEFMVALEPLRLAYEPKMPVAAREAAADAIVIALPADGADQALLDRLPTILRTTNWPPCNDTGRIAALVERLLRTERRRLGDQIAALPLAGTPRPRLLELSRLPPPERPGDVLVVPREAPRPSLHAEFVGRADDLWRIHYALLGHPDATNRGVTLTTSIEGGAGFGKTQLAAEYLHRFGPRYFPGGLFWIDAAQPVEPQHYQILKALVPAVPPLGLLQEKPGAIAALLADTLNRRSRVGAVLFVVDNVPEAPREAPPLPLTTWCPGPADVSLLVTSRRRLSLEPGRPVAAIAIDVLGLEPAMGMLQRRVEFAAAVPGQHWIDIAEAVGRLPLALQVLNASLAAGAITVSRLHQLVAGEGVVPVLDDAVAALEGKVPQDAVVRVSRAFGVSYDLLQNEERAALRLLVQLAPEPVPEAILTDELFPARARAGLVLRSFVMRVPSQDVEYFGEVHRLIGDYVRAREGVRRSDAVIARSVTSALHSRDPQEPSHWPLLSSLVVHAEHLVDRCVALDGGSPEAEFFELSNAAVQALLAQGQMRRARDLSQRTVALRAYVREPGHPGVLRAMYNLGWTLHDLGHLAEARAIKEDVLELRSRTLAADDPDLAAALQTLGWTLYEQGHLREAKRRHEAALTIVTQRFESSHPNVLWAKHSLAWTLLEWGEHARALELFREVRDVRTHLLGTDRPETLLADHSMAWALHEQGKWAEARDIHLHVLERRRRLLGEWHPDTLHTMHNLAENLASLLELDGAIATILVVLDVRKRMLRENHFDTLFSEHTYANALVLKGDLAHARELLERVHAVRLRDSGEAHQETLRVGQTLAWAAFQQGEQEQAVNRLARVIAVRQRAFPEHHPWTLRALFDMALFHLALGDSDGARERLRAVVDGAVLSLPHHPVLRRARALLADPALPVSL